MTEFHTKPGWNDKLDLVFARRSSQVKKVPAPWAGVQSKPPGRSGKRTDTNITCARTAIALWLDNRRRQSVTQKPLTQIGVLFDRGLRLGVRAKE